VSVDDRDEIAERPDQIYLIPIRCTDQLIPSLSIRIEVESESG